MLKNYIIIFWIFNYKIEDIFLESNLNNLTFQLLALIFNCALYLKYKIYIYIYIFYLTFLFLHSFLSLCLSQVFSRSFQLLFFLSNAAPISLSTKPSLSSLRGVTYVHWDHQCRFVVVGRCGSRFSKFV